MPDSTICNRRKVGIKQPEVIGKATARNEAAFLATTVGTTSLLALFAGQVKSECSLYCRVLNTKPPLINSSKECMPFRAGKLESLPAVYMPKICPA